MTTAIGQGDTLVTPLHMALIASTVANGGILMKPYYIARVETAQGELVSETDPSAYGELMSVEGSGDSHRLYGRNGQWRDSLRPAWRRLHGRRARPDQPSMRRAEPPAPTPGCGLLQRGRSGYCGGGNRGGRRHREPDGCAHCQGIFDAYYYG